jgi:hypothetical protein
VNGTITNTDISSSAAIESSKLKGNIYILTKSSAQSISNATDTNLTWGATELGGLGYTLTSSTYVNIPKDGYYLLSAGATFGANGTGARRIRIWNYALNDILAEASTAGFTGIDNVLNCSCVAQLDVGVQIYVEVYQSSGGSLNVKADKSTFFRVSMLAAYSV